LIFKVFGFDFSQSIIKDAHFHLWSFYFSNHEEEFAIRNSLANSQAHMQT